ncbi:hypothetical protein DL239_08990 [Sedimentitalea sp. CY04]|uniref:Uncharacterized protein n=1 Tax=Parasedimentitalea denitrificans TaxID=2211118 RepID=A0ABX0WAB9_9RHOB|nr:hypothetical protein [Sedimentitalea sp. CY04]NIZ61111.1 hypothetical protein [Sedimentitalea sp. CY04]
MAPSTAKSDDPVKFVGEAIEQHHDRMLKFYKSTWKRVKSFLKPLQKFLKNFIAGTKDMIATVGKEAINRITSAIRAILKVLEPIDKALQDMILLGKRILATIRKEIDKTKLIRVLKTVVRKYVEIFKKVVSFIENLWDDLGILDVALAVLNKFRLVLSMVFNWFDEVTGILTAIKKVKAQLKRAIKTLLKERKKAIRLVKDVAKLKVP